MLYESIIDPVTDLTHAPASGVDGRRWVYAFGPGFADGRGDMVAELGGKGAGLRIDQPVAPFRRQQLGIGHFAGSAGRTQRRRS